MKLATQIFLPTMALLFSTFAVVPNVGAQSSPQAQVPPYPPSVTVLDQAGEIFLVSTTRDVQAVRRCNGRDLDAPGPVTSEAAATWAEREAADVDP